LDNGRGIFRAGNESMRKPLTDEVMLQEAECRLEEHLALRDITKKKAATEQELRQRVEHYKRKKR